MCCTGTSVEHCIIRKSSEARAFGGLPKILSQGAKDAVNPGVVSLMLHPWVLVFHFVSNISGEV